MRISHHSRRMAWATVAVLVAVAFVSPPLWGQEQTTEQLEAALPALSGGRRLATLRTLVEAFRTDAPERALLYGDEVIAMATSLGDVSTEVFGFTETAWALMELGRYEDASARAREGLRRAEESGDRKGQARALNNMGVVQRRVGGYGLALDYFRRSMEIYAALGDEAAVATSLNNRAVVFGFDLGDYGRSLGDQLRVLAMRERMADEEGIYQAFNNLGVVYHNLGEYDEALARLRRALEGWRTLGRAPGIASALDNLASVYTDLGLLELALELETEALAIRENLAIPSAMAASLKGQGDILTLMGRLSEARAPLERSLAIRGDLGERKAVASGRLALARLERLSGSHATAEQLANLALDESRSIGALDVERHAWEEISTTREVRGDFAGALEAFRRFKETDDSLFGVQRSRRIEALRAEFRADQAQGEIDRLTQRAALSQSQLQNSAALLVVGLLLAVIAALLYRRRLGASRRRDLERTVSERTAALSDANERLADLSLTDSLTGLRNRRFLTQMLGSDVSITLRAYGAGTSTSEAPEESDLVFYLLDIDDFKSVNDTYGHAAGDRVLRDVGRLLVRTARASDMVVRWGGEEFLIVSRRVNRRDAAVFAERVRAAIRECEFDAGEEKSLRRTCSVGYAAFPFMPERPDALVWEQVVELADQATYLAKRSGRDAWASFASTTSTDPARIRGDLSATRALVERGELRLTSSLTQDDRTVTWDAITARRVG